MALIKVIAVSYDLYEAIKKTEEKNSPPQPFSNEIFSDLKLKRMSADVAKTKHAVMYTKPVSTV